MKPAVKAKWCKALRSGKYRQTYGTLVEDAEHQGHKSYCCLGVLRCLMPTNLQDKSLQNDGELLSRSQLKWAGLTSKAQMKLSELNDADCYKFNKIAKYIQENL